MLRLLSTIALLSLPAIISAQCAACDTYTAALVSCQKTDANVTAVGTVMDTTTLSCMCSTSSTLSDMNACLGCEESSPNVTFDPTILQAWINTCKANAQFGNQQAANCWESQPSDDLPCFSNTPGAGNLGSGTNGGSDVAPTTSSPTTSPTTTVKSDSMSTFHVSTFLMVSVVGFGMVIGV